MKSFAWTWLALAGASVLIGLTVIDGQRREQFVAEEEADKSILKLPVEAVTSLEIATKSGSTILNKSEVGWRIVTPITDDADLETVESLLHQIAEEKSKKTVVNGADLNLAAFGLEKPVTTLKLATADGRRQEVHIGSVLAYDSSLYARIDQQNRVLLVSGGWDVMLSKLPQDLRDKNLIRRRDLNFEALQRITLSREPGAGAAQPKKAVELELQREGAGWKTLRGGQDGTLSVERLKAFYEGIKALRNRGFLVAEAQAKALEALKRPTLRLELDFASAQAGGERRVWSIRLRPELNSKAGLYIGETSDLKGQAFSLSASAAQSLEKSAQDFYDKKVSSSSNLPPQESPKESPKESSAEEP